MAGDNARYAREKELAWKYEGKVNARSRAIKAEVTSRFAQMKHNEHAIPNLSELLKTQYIPAFSENRYPTPSAFFRAEMPWIFGLVVYDRFRDAFCHGVDQIRDYPYSVNWGRRSYRSGNYLSYYSRIDRMFDSFCHSGCIDADICDVLEGTLPEETLCYLRTRKEPAAGFVPEVLAYELDRDNPRLERIVTDIVNGENSFSVVTRELIRGVVMSCNPRMHQLLCRLLLAARLQEGLRQVICEEADGGTKEAFSAILETILEHNLLRYSSVKRAVGTWIGIMTDETRDLDRISNKNLELICRCLVEEEFREECLQAEDSMAIHIALWSAAWNNVECCYRILDRMIEQGTHHQVLTAGYFTATLNDAFLCQTIARKVLHRYGDRDDILAVYLPSFLTRHQYIAYRVNVLQKYADVDVLFENRAEAGKFCDFLFERFLSMKKRELVFEPCIFPWYSAKLKKSDLIEKAILIAVELRDPQRMDILCGYLSECDAATRHSYFGMMTGGKKTPAIRKTVIDCLDDKSYYTRQTAYQMAKGMILTADEYRLLEDMLRLRHDDLRRNVIDLLMRQSDAGLEGSVRRLLASPKPLVRTAGLDIVTQLLKSEVLAPVGKRCMDAVIAIAEPTAQEKILIDALLPSREESVGEQLFTEEDRYRPEILLDDYAKSCIRAFMEAFPDSKLERQILAGKPVVHGAVKYPCILSQSAASAIKNLKSLSDFVTAHEQDTFLGVDGNEIPIGSNFRSFFVWENGVNRAPRMDLWAQWQRENQISAQALLGMRVLADGVNRDFPYLVRCGKYIRDIYGPGFDQPIAYRYMEHLRKILECLLHNSVTNEQHQQIATALGIWVARCLPEEMLIGNTGDGAPSPLAENMDRFYASKQYRVNSEAEWRIGSRAGHFIAHPQIYCLLGKLNVEFCESLRYRIAVMVNVYERSFAATGAYLEKYGLSAGGRVTRLFNRIYSGGALSMETNILDAPIYLYARYFDLISDSTLYYHLMQPEVLKEALSLLTSVCAMSPAEGNVISSKTFAMYGMYRIRRSYEEFIGKDKQHNAHQQALIELCRRTADKLVPVVVNAELLRGDMPAKYSDYVTGIHVLSGAETFVRILSALGNDVLDRAVYSWSFSQSRRANLSYLLARCAPGPGDNAQRLKQKLEGTDITQKRLIEAALFSPSWIDIIGEYLNLPGFKSACYYFIAHMNEEFDEQKKAIIARFTPLSEDELNLGAFDLDWFRSAYRQLGEKKFDMIYDAAKYISDGAKHTRARKYADAALGRMTVEDTEAAVRSKRNKDLLMAYAIIPLSGEEDLIHRYLYLQQFLKESRQFGSQRSTSEKKAVEIALRNLSTNAGFSDSMRLTLRMETKLVEDNRELFEQRQVGEWTFQLLLDEQGTPAISCCKDGKPLKSIPAKGKKDPYVLRLQDMKKLLTEQYRRTCRMFEEAMEDGVVFTVEEMRRLCENPVVFPIVSRLVFKTGDSLGFFDGVHLYDPAGKLPDTSGSAELTVAHPLDLYRSGCWHSFQKYLYDNQISQPFRQVFRELYIKTEDELGRYTSLRYAGNQIQPKKAAACLKMRRWVADIEAGLQKIYYRENIVATIFAMADWFTPADIEAPTLEHVAFYDRKSGAALKIDDVPAVIFSEVMRDVDMAVSVAHAGGVDPEASHSTVEMRAAILSFTLPLLRLKNVTVEGSHAFIDGRRAKYSVHLGSGIVHQIGGTMLNVLPVHSQHRGRIFLPFVDDDPKTAEVISKVILFAEDHKLKDPTILSQISG